jgi:uncharacterized RDD family membrane protein YckC
MAEEKGSIHAVRFPMASSRCIRQTKAIIENYELLNYLVIHLITSRKDLGEIMTDEVQQELAKFPTTMEYKGVGIRFVSLLIDSIIISLLIGMIGTIFGVSMMKLGMIPWWWGLFYFIIYIAYFTIMEGHNGQTIGKMITKIRVVREEDCGKIDMARSFKRNILRIIDGLLTYLVGAVLIWRSDKKQRLGDSIAKTLVIKA